VPFTKVLRRVIYKPNKQIGNRKMLNRLGALGVAIWFMDDGHINHRKDFSIYIKIATCLSKEENQVIIDYFRETWNVHFYTFSEGRGSYSICCGTESAIKFIEIVKPYVSQIPSMAYKITYNISGRKIPVGSSESKWKTPHNNVDEDMICSSTKVEAATSEVEVTNLPEQ
jgi:hypothetical protein